MHREPDARYASADEMLEALAGDASAVPETVRPATAPDIAGTTVAVIPSQATTERRLVSLL